MSAEIKFEGFDGELCDLNGLYCRATDLNHGKPTFKKMDAGTQSVMIYFWDERDGIQLRGWWVAPEIGGSNVWAMSNATSVMPPSSGWKVPWHGEVNPKVNLAKVAGSGGGPVSASNPTSAGAKAAQNEPNRRPAGYDEPPSKYQRTGSYGAAQPPAPAYAGNYGGGGTGRPFQAYSGPNGSSMAPPAAQTAEERKRYLEQQRGEEEKAKKTVQEQQRFERRLSESINGCVLATSNAERAFLRVKDSSCVTQLFEVENLKPADLARCSAELEKGLKSALFSLSSAETLQARKMAELDGAPTQNKTTQTLRQQLVTSKQKLEASTKEAKSLHDKMIARQKQCWKVIVDQIMEATAGEMGQAESGIEGLKDASALLSSEIAEHLSPGEAISASDEALAAAKKADDALITFREALQGRRTDITTAVCFHQKQQQAAHAAREKECEGLSPNSAAKKRSEPLDDDLRLQDKRSELEKWASKVGPMQDEVNKIRQLAIQIGNRARQAEAVRKKQELKEKQKRKLERKQKWNRQLIEDLACEVTLCVDFLQTIQEKKEQLDSQERRKEAKKNKTDEDIGMIELDEKPCPWSKKDIEREFKELQMMVSKVRTTFEDFSGKHEKLQQTSMELERWGKRISEMEDTLNTEMGKDAKAALEKMKASKLAAEVPGDMMLASVFLYYLECENKSDDDLFKEISGLGPISSTNMNVSLFKLQEFAKKHPSYFSQANIERNLKVKVGEILGDDASKAAKKAVANANYVPQYIRESFEELDLPFGKDGTKKRKNALSAGMFPTMYRKTFVYERNQNDHPLIPGSNQVNHNMNNFGRINLDGVLDAICITPELNDPNDPEQFPILEHGTVVEMAGPVQYACNEDKATLRMKVKISQQNEADDIVGWVTYYSGNVCQLHEINTMKCIRETVLTANAELKGIKVIRRVKNDEMVRCLRVAPDMRGPDQKQLVRIFCMSLTDEKTGYVTLMNGPQTFLRCELVPKEIKGGKGKEAQKAVPVVGSMRVALGEAILANRKDPETGDMGLQSAFLVERVDEKRINIAWEEDESLEKVDINSIRCRYDEKKKCDLSVVTKEQVQKQIKVHFENLVKDINLPDMPETGVSAEELIGSCIYSLREGEVAERKLRVFHRYISKKEIRTLVYGEPNMFSPLLNKFNELQMENNKRRLACKQEKDSADQRIKAIDDEKKAAELEQERAQMEEEEKAVQAQLTTLSDMAGVFTKDLREKLSVAAKAGQEVGADWDQLIGDVEFALKEREEKREEALAYITENEPKYERLKLRFGQWREKLEKMARDSHDGQTDTEKLEGLRKTAFSGIFDKYLASIQSHLESTGESAESLFKELSSSLKNKKATKELGSEEPVLAGATLKGKFPCSLDIPNLTLEQFKLYIGNYYVVSKETALTTTAQVAQGSLVRNLPQYTVVQVLGEVEKDGDTDNLRRKVKIIVLPEADDGVEEDSETGMKKNIPEDKITGFMTVHEASANIPTVSRYGIPNLSSPILLTKDGVLTTIGRLDVKLDVIRRVRKGEKVELLGVPMYLTKNKSMRIKAKCCSDKKVGWFTLIDSMKVAYAELL